MYIRIILVLLSFFIPTYQAAEFVSVDVTPRTYTKESGLVTYSTIRVLLARDKDTEVEIPNIAKIVLKAHKFDTEGNPEYAKNEYIMIYAQVHLYKNDSYGLVKKSKVLTMTNKITNFETRKLNETIYSFLVSQGVSQKYLKELSL